MRELLCWNVLNFQYMDEKDHAHCGEIITVSFSGHYKNYFGCSALGRYFENSPSSDSLEGGMPVRNIEENANPLLFWHLRPSLHLSEGAS